MEELEKILRCIRPRTEGGVVIPKQRDARQPLSPRNARQADGESEQVSGIAMHREWRSGACERALRA